MTARWSRPVRSGLVWRNWDSAAVVFHEESGQTHYLNELARWIVEHLGCTPSTTDEICESLAAAYGVDVDDELEVTAAATLTTLTRLGLVLKRGDD